MEENKDVKEEVVPVEPSTTETTTEEVAKTPEEAETKTVETEPVETETEGEKKGAQSRIRELNTKAKVAEEEAKSLREKLAELTSPVGQGAQMPQYSPQEPITGEIDANEFQKRVLQQADARTELRIRQSEAVNRINNEASEVEQKYPELNKNSENYNKRLSEKVAETVEKLVKANPYTTSVKKEVEDIMSLFNEGIATEVGQAGENIAKQVSQAALRPTAVRKQEKSAKELSIAELEAKLGVVQA